MGGHDPYSSSKGCAELVTAAYRASFSEIGVATARAGNVIGGGDWAEDGCCPTHARAGRRRAIAIRNPHAVRPWQHVLDPLCGYLLPGRRLHDDPAALATPGISGRATTTRGRSAGLRRSWRSSGATGELVPCRADRTARERSLKVDASTCPRETGLGPAAAVARGAGVDGGMASAPRCRRGGVGADRPADRPRYLEYRHAMKSLAVASAARVAAKLCRSRPLAAGERVPGSRRAAADGAALSAARLRLRRLSTGAARGVRGPEHIFSGLSVFLLVFRSWLQHAQAYAAQMTKRASARPGLAGRRGGQQRRLSAAIFPASTASACSAWSRPPMWREAAPPRASPTEVAFFGTATAPPPGRRAATGPT